MRILIVTNQFPSKSLPYKGTFIFQQAEELIRRGNNIFVVTPNYGLEAATTTISGIKIFRFTPFTKKTKDPLLRDLFKGINGYFSLLLFLFFQFIEILRISVRYNIKVIHAHWVLPSGFSSVLAAKILRKKIVITSHGSDLTFCSKNMILRAMLKIVLLNTDYFVGVTEYLTKIAINLGMTPDKSQTIHLGVPKSLVSYRNTTNQHKEDKFIFNIVFIGSLYPVKGITALLDLILKLSEIRKDFEFSIIGDGELMGQVTAFISDNKLKNHCRVLGFLPHNQVLEWIQKSDLVVQTSLSEGLSMVIQESIYLGKAVVATDVGGTKEIIIDGYNGYLIKPNDVNSMVKKLDNLFSDPQRIRLMGQNSIKIAEDKLVLERNVKKIISLYKMVLSK